LSAITFAATASQAASHAGGGGGVAVVIDVDGAEATELIAPLFATAVKVYVVPELKPVTVIGEELPDAVTPPGVEVTVYVVIALPPLLVGAVNETDAVVCPVAVAVTVVGAPGVVIAVTDTEVVPGLFPGDALFTARTWIG
jgi:hypothetical protein